MIDIQTIDNVKLNPCGFLESLKGEQKIVILSKDWWCPPLANITITNLCEINKSLKNTPNMLIV